MSSDDSNDVPATFRRYSNEVLAIPTTFRWYSDEVLTIPFRQHSNEVLTILVTFRRCSNQVPTMFQHLSGYAPSNKIGNKNNHNLCFKSKHLSTPFPSSNSDTISGSSYLFVMWELWHTVVLDLHATTTISWFNLKSKLSPFFSQPISSICPSTPLCFSHFFMLLSTNQHLQKVQTSIASVYLTSTHYKP